MPTYRVTWEFESLQQQTGQTASARVGWTESWYIDSAGNLEEALIEAVRVLRPSWLGLRLQFLSSLYRIAWVKATNIANPFETKTVGLPAILVGNAGNVNGVVRPGEGAQVNCAAMVDFYAPPTVPGEKSHHRRMLFRGLPTLMIDGNIIRENALSFAAMLVFCDYVGVGRSPVRRLQQNTSPWRMLVQSPAAAKRGITALSIVPNTAGRKISLEASLGALARGDRVNITGVRFPSGMNRVWTVTTLGPDGGPYLLGTSRRELSGVWDQIPTAKAQVVTPAVRVCTQYTVIGLRNRKTGGPSHGTPGRRRAR